VDSLAPVPGARIPGQPTAPPRRVLSKPSTGGAPVVAKSTGPGHREEIETFAVGARRGARGSVGEGSMKGHRDRSPLPLLFCALVEAGGRAAAVRARSRAGERWFSVRALDAAGNPGKWSSIRRFEVKN
jgi:hypothetical protein